MNKLSHDVSVLFEHCVVQGVLARRISKAENLVILEKLLRVDLEHHLEEIVPVLPQGFYQRRLCLTAAVLERKCLAKHFGVWAVALNVMVELQDQPEDLRAS